MNFTFVLLSFVTIGLIIGSISQFALLRQLQDSNGHPFWKNDKEAEILRLGHIKPEVLSWSPRITLLHNFLSMEECEHLKAITLPHLSATYVADAETGQWKKSSSMFLGSEDRKHPIVQSIEQRISVYAQVPIENGERIKIFSYEKNQYYMSHYDFFNDTYSLKFGGQRIATMLMYISDNFEGGETYFPSGGSGECNCGGKILKGLSIKPIKGNAILFWSVGLSGQVDTNSHHEACVVLSGVKWIAVKWLHERDSRL